jgi:DNA-binding transcriptional MerR regulator
MRIGELSNRTGASPRSIRYYESVGLLTCHRDGNGYRDFDAGAVELIVQIKLLLQTGLDMTDIVDILPCVGSPGECSRVVRQRFNKQLARIERQQPLLAQAKELLLDLRAEGVALAAPGETIRAVSGNVTVGIH